jgi:hypothetical protein
MSIIRFIFELLNHKQMNTTFKQKHVRKEIKYWEAVSYQGNLGPTIIDVNNSIAILRARYGNSVVYNAIR